MANGNEIVDRSEKQIKDGDISGLQNSLNALNSKESQQIYMAIIGKECKYSSNVLPDCVITGAEDNPSKISFKGEHPLTISNDGSKLSVQNDGKDATSFWDKAKQAVSDVVKSLDDAPHNAANGMKEAVKDTTAGDANNRAHTEDSEQNRRWQEQEKKQGL